jgi:acetoin utilization deacetylase AcuC-like enzyme
MKIVYHPRFEAVYAGDPAASEGRIQCIVNELPSDLDFVTPEPASDADILLVHTDFHVESIRRSPEVYEVALLAAGGAIRAAELALAGEPAFGVIRPPGHHANPDHCWGFCFFNNVAISIARLRHDGKIDTAVILDFDLHFGDGTDAIFGSVPDVSYFHPESSSRQEFVESISGFLDGQKADIIAVSAGFDRHEKDWGQLLTTNDYESIGGLVRQFAERACGGRRYGVLEGGYNHSVLGANVSAFIEGMS